MKKENNTKKIMSGDYSGDMWYAISHAKTKRELREALYFVCCRLQELETKYDNQIQGIYNVVVTQNEDKRD